MRLCRSHGANDSVATLRAWSGLGARHCSMCAVTSPSKSATLVQHISDMDKELQAGEGCHVYGDILVRRIEGVIRFSAHIKDFMMLKSTRESLEEQMLAQFKKFQENHGAGTVEVCPCAVAQYPQWLWLSLISFSRHAARGSRLLSGSQAMHQVLTSTCAGRSRGSMLSSVNWQCLWDPSQKAAVLPWLTVRCRCGHGTLVASQAAVQLALDVAGRG